ncbi:uncharacterized protein A4U43_C07F31530 [Asparagus officinalis]|uniref:Uncharacterized protein n=1 Tax=Asparagus officinalis TaxID=4686 RepID=A0A5P1EG99_ASPOF|nr:uncharacterized protein A4U43_C07F31530 [Asparagus officinalis]
MSPMWSYLLNICTILLHTLGEHTPTSNTGNFGYQSHFGDKTDKGLEEPRGSVFSDDRCTFANASLDQSSEGWLANCLSNIDTHRSSGEMSSFMNDSFISNEQV